MPLQTLKNCSLAGVLLAAFSSAEVIALGMGRLHAQSHLGEPFDATIELIDAGASAEAVSIVGLPQVLWAPSSRPWTSLGDDLTVNVYAAENGRLYANLKSRALVDTPAVRFVLQARVGTAKVEQRFRLLLSSPPNVAQFESKNEGAVRAATRATELLEIESARTAEHLYLEGTRQVIKEQSTQWVVSGKETLSEIAMHHRPNSRVSVNQMMIAIQDANPNSFIRNNVNLLRQGTVLRMPSEREVGSVSAGFADLAINQQKQEWLRARQLDARRVELAQNDSAANADQILRLGSVDESERLAMEARLLSEISAAQVAPLAIEEAELRTLASVASETNTPVELEAELDLRRAAAGTALAWLVTVLGLFAVTRRRKSKESVEQVQAPAREELDGSADERFTSAYRNRKVEEAELLAIYGRYDEAIELLNLAAKDDPSAKQYAQCLHEVYLLAGRFQLAADIKEETARPALIQHRDTSANDTDWMAMARPIELVQAYMELDDEDGARNLLNEIMSDESSQDRDRARGLLEAL